MQSQRERRVLPLCLKSFNFSRAIDSSWKCCCNFVDFFSLVPLPLSLSRWISCHRTQRDQDTSGSHPVSRPLSLSIYLSAILHRLARTPCCHSRHYLAPLLLLLLLLSMVLLRAQMCACAWVHLQKKRFILMILSLETHGYYHFHRRKMRWYSAVYAGPAVPSLFHFIAFGAMLFGSPLSPSPHFHQSSFPLPYSSVLISLSTFSRQSFCFSPRLCLYPQFFLQHRKWVAHAIEISQWNVVSWKWFRVVASTTERTIRFVKSLCRNCLWATVHCEPKMRHCAICS